MFRKINFLAIAVISILAIFIVDAAEENSNESSVNENSNFNKSYINIEYGFNNTNTVQNNEIGKSANNNSIQNNAAEHSNDEKKQGNSVTASFGVYLKIVG